MHWIKKVLIILSSLAASAALGTVLIIGIVNTVNWDRHTRSVTWAIETFTDWDVVSLQGIEAHVGGEFHLKLSDARFRTAAGDSLFSELGGKTFELQMKTWPLVWDRKIIIEKIWLDQGLIALKETQKKEDVDWQELLNDLPSVFIASAGILHTVATYMPLGPLPVHEMFLETLTLDAESSFDPVKFRGHGSLEKERLALDGQLGSFQSFLAQEGPYPIRVHWELGKQVGALTGTLALAAKTYELALLAHGDNLRKYKAILPSLQGEPEEKRYRFTANLHYDQGMVRLSNIHAELGKSHIQGHLEADARDGLQSLKIDAESALVRATDVTFLVPDMKTIVTPHVLKLDSLSVNAPNVDTPITVKAAGVAAKIPFRLDGETGSLEKIQKPDSPFPIRLELALHGQNLRLNADLERRNQTYSADIQARGQNLASLLKIVRPSLASSRMPSYDLAFRAKYKESQVTLAGIRLRLGQSRLTADSTIDMTKPDMSLLVTIGKSAIRIADIQALVGNVSKESEKLSDQTIHIESIRVSSNSAKATIPIRGKGRVGAIDISLDGSMGSLQKLKSPRTPYPIDVKVSVEGQQLNLHTLLDRQRERHEVRLNAQGTDLMPIFDALQYAPPHPERLPPYHLALHAFYSSNLIQVKHLKAAFGSSVVRAEGSVSLQGKPVIAGELTSTSIDLEDFSAFRSSEPEAKKGPIFSRDPFPLGIMQRFNADVDVTIKEIKGGTTGKLLDHAEATMKLRDGNLDLAVHSLGVAQGRIAGEFALQSGRELPKFSGKIGVTGVHLQTLIKPFAEALKGGEIKPADYLSGKLFSAISLNASGKSMWQMASSLNGQIQVGADDGHIGLTIVEVLGMDVTQTISSWFRDMPPTPLNCAITVMQIQKGVMRARDFFAGTEDSNIWGEGYIDLGREKMNFEIKMRPKDFSVGSVRTPIKIVGPLQNPDVQVNREGIVLRVVAAVALGAYVSPVAAVIPFIEPGLGKEGQCKKFQTELADIRAKSRRVDNVTAR